MSSTSLETVEINCQFRGLLFTTIIAGIEFLHKVPDCPRKTNGMIAPLLHELVQ
jgi:hypothetical protein